MAVEARDIQDPQWTLGERLAKARKHAGWNQEQMAALLEVSPSTIAKWEANRGQPRALMERIAKWSELTEVSQAWILGFTSGGLWDDADRTDRHLHLIDTTSGV